MTREEWQHVKAITAGALGMQAQDRERFIAAHCADAALRSEVCSLLDAALAAENLFESSALTADCARAVLDATDDSPASFVGQRIGSYRVIRELGRGGMGTAYLAERIDGVYHRRVAIKLIKRGMDTDAIVRRFLHERQILANLSHPNIAMLLDGGSSEDGRPYFVIEYVEGVPIDVFCRERRLSIEQRLRLFYAVCEAVDHAHQNRVIHRDLKPGNILVTAAGTPKLLDFGIAKLLDPQDEGAADHTQFAPAMTLRYASPEQVRGETITTASDVYSLGVLLYGLLTGRSPYRLDDVGRHEAERIVAEQMPPPPSRAIERNGAAAPAHSTQITRDLDAIVLTALEKEPARRYSSARALAEDVDRHLRGQRVQAPPARRGTNSFGRVGRAAGVWLAAALLVIALAGAAAWFRSAAGKDRAVTSIAVLPFTGAATDRDLAYLSDGVTESIIQRLSTLSQVRVIARDSAFSYRDKPVDAFQIGRELGVEAVLEGTFARRNDQLVVSVALVDVRNRRRLWGDEFVRRTADLQVLQADLAQQIAGGLRLQLSPAERTRVARTGTVDAEAYHLYLKGRYFLNKRTVEDLRQAIESLTQAVAKEARFAAAHAALAGAYGLLTEYHGAAATDTYAAARTAAARALELDRDLAEAHTAVAYVKHYYEWDWRGAEAAYRQAIALNPGDATAHQWYAELLSVSGRHEEALSEIRRAAENDPLSLIVNSVEAYLLYLARRYDESIEQCRKVIDLDPNFPEVYIYLKRSLDEKGLFHEAVEARQTRRALLGLGSERSEALRVAASTTDRLVYWRKRLDQELEESKTEGLLPFDLAEIQTQAGDPLAALDALERACGDGDFMSVTVHVIPTLDALRGEPRFKALLARGCAIGGRR